jgi:hypothetical protein
LGWFLFGGMFIQHIGDEQTAIVQRHSFPRFLFSVDIFPATSCRPSQDFFEFLKVVSLPGNLGQPCRA